jgi:hypothetical protein
MDKKNISLVFYFGADVIPCCCIASINGPKFSLIRVITFRCPANSWLLTRERSFFAFEKNSEAVLKSFFCARPAQVSAG